MVTKVIKKQVNRAIGHKFAEWSPEQKLDAVIKYLETGSIKQTSDILSIPYHTVRNWRYEDWWHKAERSCREELNMEAEVKLRGVAKSAAKELEDRLSQGEVVYNFKTDTFKRVPVRAAVVNQILKTSMEKQQELAKGVGKETVTDKAVADRLADLAQQFLRFAKSSTIEAQSGPTDNPMEVEATPLPKRL
jgi:transposase-like protein